MSEVYCIVTINKSAIFSTQGNQGDFWLRGEVNLSFMKMNFQVVIEGKRGGGYKGDIAIDDVSFTPGCNVDYAATLPPFPQTVSPPSGCKSGEFKYVYFYYQYLIIGSLDLS